MFLERLQTRFPEDTLSWLCAALREVPPLWECLASLQSLQELPQDPCAWTPAALALHILEFPLSPREYARRAPAGRLPHPWEQRITQALERHLQQQAPQEPPLQHAALVALALRAELGRTGDWHYLLPHLRAIPLTHWQTPLAILPGLLSAPEGLYRTLLLRENLHPLLWQSLLSQPLPPEEQHETIHTLLRELPPLLLPAALTSLHLRRPALTQALRQRLQGALQGLPHERYRQALLALPWEEQPQPPASPSGQAPVEESRAALHLLRADETDAAAALLSPQDEHPARLAVRAHLAHTKGETARARQLAQRALQDLRAAPIHAPDVYHLLGETLLHLDAPQEAAYLLEHALQQRPSDPALLRLYAAALQRAGQTQQAIHAARLACSLSPGDLPCLRTLAAAYEQAARWPQALEVRQTILQANPESPADHYALGLCALQSGNLALAQQAAEAALQRAPQHGLSHTLMGRIHQALGDSQRAIEHYRQATRLSPHHPEAWLALAEAQRSADDLPAALDTLRSASQVAAQEPEIHLRLGQCILQAGLPEQALAPLQQAARLCGLPVLSLEEENPPPQLRIPPPLSDLMSRTAAALGEAWAAQGRHPLALPYLRLAYHHDPGDGRVAQRYARTLLALNRYPEAASVLEHVLATHPPAADPYVDFALACLHQGACLPQARQALETALQLEPQNPQAHALLGEILAESGAYPQALEHYHLALQSPLGQHPEWRVRLTLGFTYVSLELGQPENAIASLQALLQHLPQHARLQQALYEAYRKAGLLPESREQLDILFHLYRERPDNLLWLAEEARRIGHDDLKQRIMAALEESPPQEAEALLRWGMLYARNDEPQQATAIFAHLIADPHTPPEILQRAGQSLLQAGYPGAAIVPLEAARHRSDSPAETLLQHLSQAYHQSGQTETALQVLTEFLQAHPLSLPLLKQAARLHLAQGQNASALDYLEAVLSHAPDDLEARRLLLETLQQEGQLLQAYQHACWMARYLSEHAPHTHTCQQARYIAAGLACELLDFQAARAFLEELDSGEAQALMLRAELALHFEAEVEAAQAVQAALALAPQSPRVIALQARLLHRQGALADARRVLGESLARQEFTPGERRALGLAAIELEDLEAASRLLAPLAEIPQRSPWGALLYVQAQVIQAEQAALAQALEMHVSVLPGEQAASVQETLQKLQFCFAQQELPLPDTLLRWEQRARLLFDDHAPEEYPSEQPAELSACLMSMRRSGGVDPQQAASLARRAPDSPLVWLQLALTLETAAPEQALQAARRALQQAPSRDWRWYAGSHYLCARLHLAAGAPQKALQSLEEALALHPHEIAWRRKALQAAHACNRYPEAARHAEALRSMQALSPADALLLAEAQRALGNPQAALQTLQELTERQPEHAPAWHAMAEIHALQQDWGACARCAERALQHGMSAALRLRIRAALHLQDGRAARLRAAQLVKQFPQEAEAWYLLAQSWQLLEQPQHVLRAMRKALSLCKRAPLPWHLTCLEALAAVEGDAAALQAIQPLLQQYPHEESLLRLAIALAEQAGDTQQALSLAQAALQQEAGLRAEVRAGLHLVAGRVLYQHGQLDQAVHHLTQAVESAPENAEAWFSLGKVYEDRREFRPALRAYERACALSPDDARPYERAGLCYKAISDFPRAERAIRHAASLAPADVRLQRLLASLTALNVVHNA